MRLGASTYSFWHFLPEKVFQILKSINYRGYVLIEFEEKEDPFTGVPKL